MKIELIGEPKVIISNPNSIHNYFAWPSVTRLQDGRIAVACSGFRLKHVCPFGKACIVFSDDEGETYTPPMPVIDTVLDDRDAGLCTFGDKGLILTSFNNTRYFQRGAHPEHPYINAYLDKISDEQEKEVVGAEFCISYDCGKTFGKIYKTPVTSPHGPITLNDGTVLWVGRAFSDHDSYTDGIQGIYCYTINTDDGSMDYVSKIESDPTCKFCEAHVVQCNDGRLVCHLRADTYFNLYQCESFDNGKTWSKPHKLIDEKGGAPAHLIRTESGMLVSAYGYRERPYGIKLMFSIDNGETWDCDNRIYSNENDDDIGYPATVQLNDGTFLTVFYAHPDGDAPAVIMQQKWKIK